jgi:2'-5' RNA ligase
MSGTSAPALQRMYDSFWESAEAAVARGEVKVDDHLRDREADRRRGLTVMFRLEETVANAIGGLIDELKREEPGQYFYTPQQCHVTVLSLRTATSEYIHEPQIIAAYEQALDEALAETGAFPIRFAGVTATPEAVLICGFPEGNALNQLRGKIFDTLEARGLPVKQRYRPTTAHVTVMRFCQPPGNLPAIMKALRSSRTRSFGTSQVRKIELVENDWYMSPDRLRCVRTYEL